jgi:hypothetical protein
LQKLLVNVELGLAYHPGLETLTNLREDLKKEILLTVATE